MPAQARHLGCRRGMLLRPWLSVASVAAGAASVVLTSPPRSEAYCASSAGLSTAGTVVAELSADEPPAAGVAAAGVGAASVAPAAASVSATLSAGVCADSAVAAPRGTTASLADDDLLSSPVELIAATATTPITSAAATPVTNR